MCIRRSSGSVRPGSPPRRAAVSASEMSPPRNRGASWSRTCATRLRASGASHPSTPRIAVRRTLASSGCESANSRRTRSMCRSAYPNAPGLPLPRTDLHLELAGLRPLDQDAVGAGGEDVLVHAHVLGAHHLAAVSYTHLRAHETP